MEKVVAELTSQIPNAVAVIVTVVFFLRSAEKQDAARTANAAELESKREQHEFEMYKMWEKLFKQIIKKMDENQNALIQKINDHEDAMEERYDKFQITKELVDAATKKT